MSVPHDLFRALFPMRFHCPALFSDIGAAAADTNSGISGPTQSSACLQVGVREQFRPLLFISVCHASMVSFLNTTFLSSTDPLASKAV